MKKNYTIKQPLSPPWLMYPHLRRFSIGWRMGTGEGYMIDFVDWYSNLKDNEQKHYQQIFPEPKGWLGWYYNEADEDIREDGIIQWNKDGKMKYSLEELQHDFRKGKNNKYIFFWGHQPSSNGDVTKSCFSQWWKSDFRFCTNRYCCMEQYMMAEKARLFKDNEILEEIMKETNPKIIKALGRKIKNFDERLWEKNRSAIILNGNLAKFLQNDELKQFLLSTKNKVIVEASPYDKIWGIGMSADDEKIENPLEWKGLNLLGFTLMEVRYEIRHICANEEMLDLEELHEEYD